MSQRSYPSSPLCLVLQYDRTRDHVADPIDRFWHDQRFDCGAVALLHLGKTSNQENETLKAERKDLQAKVEILQKDKQELEDILHLIEGEGESPHL